MPEVWKRCLLMKIRVFMTVYYYHVTYVFQSESTLYSCLNVKELRAQTRREIWSLSCCNWPQTHNNFIHKLTLKRTLALNGWVFVYELSGCGFESSYSNRDFIFKKYYKRIGFSNENSYCSMKRLNKSYCCLRIN